MNAAIYTVIGALNLVAATLVLGYHSPIGILPSVLGLICLAGIE